MSIALYRRYRPETFADVIGQEHVTDPLKAALRGNRVTHAYLFSGPRGCGKTTSARILARCLNCADGPTDTPCGTCDSCRELSTGGPGSLDVVEIDAASHNGVDDARELRERAAFAPVRDRYKIFILDEAHMVTPQGFNALLKLVEEPPEHVKFVFATTEPEKVIGTIRSRTHHYPFRLVPPDVLQTYLGQLCGRENITVSEGVFPLVVRAGGGSVRDSLSVLDQLIAGSVAGSIDYNRAVTLLGYTDATLLDEIVTSLGEADGAGAFTMVERIVNSGLDPRRFTEDLLQRLRDLLVMSVAGQRSRDVLHGVPEDQFARMIEQVRLWGGPKLSAAADATAKALSEMVGATSPRLQLELLVGRLLVRSQTAAATPAQNGGVNANNAGGTQTRTPGGKDDAQRPALAGRAVVADVVDDEPDVAPEDMHPAVAQALQRLGGGAAIPKAGSSPEVRPAAGVEPESIPEVTSAVTPTPVVGPAVSAKTTVSTPIADSVSVGAPDTAPVVASEPAPSFDSVPAPAQVLAQKPEPVPTPVPVAAASADTSGEGMRERWGEVLAELGKVSRASHALIMQNGDLQDITPDGVTINFSSEGLLRAFGGRHQGALEAALKNVFGRAISARATIGSSTGIPGTKDTNSIERPGNSGMQPTQSHAEMGQNFGNGTANTDGIDGSYVPFEPAPTPITRAVKTENNGATQGDPSENNAKNLKTSDPDDAYAQGWGPVAVPGGGRPDTPKQQKNSANNRPEGGQKKRQTAPKTNFEQPWDEAISQSPGISVDIIPDGYGVEFSVPNEAPTPGDQPNIEVKPPLRASILAGEKMVETPQEQPSEAGGAQSALAQALEKAGAPSISGHLYGTFGNKTETKEQPEEDIDAQVSMDDRNVSGEHAVIGVNAILNTLGGTIVEEKPIGQPGQRY